MFGFLKKSASSNTASQPPHKLRIDTNRYSITCEVHFSSRRTLSLSIQKQGCSVVVKAPLGMPLSTIEGFIHSKKLWLDRHLYKLETIRNQRTARVYNHGATHLYLGDSYSLRFVISDTERVFIDGSCITISSSTESRCEPLLRRWYAVQSTDVFTALARPLTSSFGARHGRFPAKLEFKYVKTYWGVCTSSGTIRLNIELMRAPKACIEYIIVHELCHLVHANHSKLFYDLLTAELPDWRERKKLLDTLISCQD